MQAISDTLNNLDLGEPVSFGGLTLFPIMGREGQAPDYETLDVALEQSHARVVEVSDEGSVPNLLFDNHGERRVLLVDGDELVGAKQNRVVNITILVPAHKAIEIPVSCVEAGRWTYHSREFSSAGRNMYSRARASKMEQVSQCMQRTGGRHSDQSAVWDDIDACAADLDVRSATGSMSDIFEDYERDLEAYRKAFNAQDGQLGAVFAVNGKARGLELFDSSATFAHYLERLVSSYALGTVQRGKQEVATPRSEAEGFMEGIKQARADCFESLGEGEDVRLSGELLAGGALVADERVVHLAAFHLDDAASESRRYQERWISRGEV